MDQGSHGTLLSGSPWECGRGLLGGSREGGIDIHSGPGDSRSSTCPSATSSAYVQEYAAARYQQATGPFRQRSTASCSRCLWVFILCSADGPRPNCWYLSCSNS